MRFFVPHAKDDEEAESVLASTAAFVGASVPREKTARIRALTWEHNGKQMQCEVGQPMPRYYGTGNEPVIAIFDAGNHYMICTPSRGVVRGDPILAGERRTGVTYFTE